MYTEIIKDTTYYLELIVTNVLGEPVSGLTVNYTVKKSSDDSLVTSGQMNDLGNGVYKKEITLNNLGQYRIEYDTPSGYTDEIETVMVIEEKAKESTLLRGLGLMQENMRIVNPVYHTVNTAQGPRPVLTSSTVKIYASKTDTDNDVNPIAIYSMTATHDSQALMTSYKMVRLA